MVRRGLVRFVGVRQGRQGKARHSVSRRGAARQARCVPDRQEVVSRGLAWNGRLGVASPGWNGW